jgi:protein tyrosine/serine phosphatase
MLFYLYNMIYDLTSSFIYSKTSVDEIIPNIWLGNYRAAIDLDFLRKNKINFILNCTPNTPLFNEIYTREELKKLQKIETYRIPVDDSLMEKDFILMEKYFKIIIPLLLRKYTIEKKRILIHCHAGKQRSAIVVAALLKVLLDKQHLKLPEIPKTNCPKEQFRNIYNYLLEKRPQVFTYGLRINFEPTYQRFFKIF